LCQDDNKRQFITRITSHRQLTRDIWELRCDLPSGMLSASPGQFVMIEVSPSLQPFLRRPFSIAYRQPAPSGKGEEFAVIYRVVGEGTRRLKSLSPGDEVNIIGPLGRGFTWPRRDDRRPVLIGGGLGVPPLLFLAQRMVASGVVPQFFAGFTRADQAVGLDMLSELGVVPVVATDDGSLGRRGLVTELLPDPPPGDLCVYSCGPLPMLQAVASWCRTGRIPCEVSLENRMACGVGACLGCAWPAAVPESHDRDSRRYVLICKDGPVFAAEEVFAFDR